MNVLHTIAALHPDAGGPVRTVTSLVNNLAEEKDVKVGLVTQKLAGEKIYSGGLERDDISILTGSSRVALRYGQPFYMNLSELVASFQPEIIHDHGIWLPVNHIVSRLASKRDILRVIHTRGMLEPWALSYRSYKKKLAWRLYQKSDLGAAALFFATAESEAKAIRKVGLKQPIAMIPNGVDLPSFAPRVTANVDRVRRRNVVFMSRIHPKKGLVQLIEAWGEVKAKDWKLILAGPNEDNHLSDVLALVKRLGLNEVVEYIGVVEGRAKSELLMNADLFILPSFSENFGVVVAEALAHRTPVISTHGTPWKGLVDNKCGWWVAAETSALATALLDAISLSDDERREMGMRAQLYAKQFNWTQIAHETADVYRWLLGKAECPACVRFD